MNYSISEIVFLRVAIMLCVPSILILGFAPVVWMLTSVCRMFKDDPSSPGLVVSWIQSEKRWYVSVCRYKGNYGSNKEVVFKAYHSWLMIAMLKVLSSWAYNRWTVKIAPVIARLRYKNFKNWYLARKVQIAEEKFRRTIDTNRIVAGHEFDKFMNSIGWNATQKMFISSLKQAVVKYGPISGPSVLFKTPFDRIGDPRKLFARSQYDALLRIAGVDLDQIALDEQVNRLAKIDNEAYKKIIENEKTAFIKAQEEMNKRAEIRLTQAMLNGIK